MLQDLATAHIDVKPKLKRTTKRSRPAAFTYGLNSTDGLVIHQAAAKVSKKDWDDLERFIHFCQAGARVPLTITVKLRPPGACNNYEVVSQSAMEVA